jgi:hypothetical protein
VAVLLRYCGNTAFFHSNRTFAPDNTSVPREHIP